MWKAVPLSANGWWWATWGRKGTHCWPDVDVSLSHRSPPPSADGRAESPSLSASAIGSLASGTTKCSGVTVTPPPPVSCCAIRSPPRAASHANGWAMGSNPETDTPTTSTTPSADGRAESPSLSASAIGSVASGATKCSGVTVTPPPPVSCCAIRSPPRAASHANGWAPTSTTPPANCWASGNPETGTP